MQRNSLLAGWERLEERLRDTEQTLRAALAQLAAGQLPAPESASALPRLMEAYEALIGEAKARPTWDERLHGTLSPLSEWVRETAADESAYSEASRLIDAVRLHVTPQPDWWLSLLEESRRRLEPFASDAESARATASFWTAVYRLTDPDALDDDELAELLSVVARRSRDVELALFRKRIAFVFDTVPDKPGRGAADSRHEADASTASQAETVVAAEAVMEQTAGEAVPAGSIAEPAASNEPAPSNEPAASNELVASDEPGESPADVQRPEASPSRTRTTPADYVLEATRHRSLTSLSLTFGRRVLPPVTVTFGGRPLRQPPRRSGRARHAGHRQ